MDEKIRLKVTSFNETVEIFSISIVIKTSCGLSESTNEGQEFTAVKLYNFNNLLKLSKAQNRFISFFKSIGEEFISFSSWLLRTKEFTPVSTTEETPLAINSNYKDLYEINQQIKMKENSYHYIDHPFFGAVIKVSLWPSE